MSNTLDYESLNKRLVEWIPELKPRYEKVLGRWGEEEPGPHITYGDVLNFHMISLLEPDEAGRDTEQLERVFRLLEEMANSADEAVRGVLTATVCWYLTGKPEYYERAKPYMGPRTRELCQTTEPY